MSVIRHATIIGTNILALGEPVRCSCGSDDLMCVAPGQDEISISIVGTTFVQQRGIAVSGRCRACLVTEKRVSIGRAYK